MAAVGLLETLKRNSQLQDIWIAFGVGKHYKIISVDSIVKYIGSDKAAALPFWYVFTGCDQVSQFRGKGKKSAWKAWQKFPDATLTFKYFTEKPFKNITSEEEEGQMHLDVLERYVLIIYSATSCAMTVNVARLELFSSKNQNMENLPPTKNSLEQH